MPKINPQTMAPSTRDANTSDLLCQLKKIKLINLKEKDIVGNVTRGKAI